jgi:hypothetical protein
VTDARTARLDLGPTLRHLAEMTARYRDAAFAYGPILKAAGQAEAAHKKARAQFMVRLRDSGGARSVAEAEMHAEADEHIADLHQQRLLTRGVADSHYEMLRQLRTEVEAIRSYVATEREADRHHAAGYHGAP